MVDYPNPTSQKNAVGLIIISRDLLLRLLTEMMARGIADFSIVITICNYRNFNIQRH